MKAFVTVVSLMVSANILALETGSFTNIDFTAEDAQMYKSVNLDTSLCDNGGAIVKFYGADKMNFCLGQESRDVFKYKKCVGKEVNQYPVKFCVGVKRTAELVTEKKVTRNENNEVVLTEKNFDDGKLYFEQSYALSKNESGNLVVKFQFKDLRDERSGDREYSFQKD